MRAAFESLMASLVASLAGGNGAAPALVPAQPGQPSPAKGETGATPVAVPAAPHVNIPGGGRPSGPTLGLPLMPQIQATGVAEAAQQTTSVAQQTASPALLQRAGETGQTQPLPPEMVVPVQTAPQAMKVIKQMVAQMQPTVQQPASPQQAAPTGEVAPQTILAQGMQAAQATGIDAAAQPASSTAPTTDTAAPRAGTEAEPSLLQALGGQSTSAPAATTQAAPSASPAQSAPAPTQQIAEQVQMTLERGEQSATIRLQPEELGSVRVRLQMQNGQLHLSIEAEQQQTSTLLTQKIADLRSSLETQGIRVGDLAVANGRAVAGSEGAQRDAAAQFRPATQVDMSSGFNQQSQQQSQQQAAFAGQDQNMQQRNGSQFAEQSVQNGAGSPADIAGATLPSGGAHHVARAATLAGVDYYA